MSNDKTTRTTADHSNDTTHSMATMDHSKMDHSKMDHCKMDHSMMDHTKMDHSMMNHGQMGHGGHDHSHHAKMFRDKLLFSLILAIPIIVLSPMMGMDFPFQFTFPDSDWVVLILATILYFYGGKPFIDGAVSEFQKKSPGMMALITLGISVSYIYSVYAFINNTFFNPAQPQMNFFWELATLILIMLLGHWIEMKAVGNAGNALEQLSKLLPNTALKIDDQGNTQEIPLKEVVVGDTLLVRGSDKIPTDGIIKDGSSAVNESMVTGESKEVTKNIGDQVIGGSINGSGTLTIEVTGTGESGYLAKVMSLVGEAQADKSKAELLSDRVAKWLFYIAFVVAIIAFIIWYMSAATFDEALLRLVTVLIIACPHALGLAIPLVVARSTSIGAQNGLLIRDRHANEVAKDIDIVVMDKTGTLTEGDFKVNNFINYAKDEHPDTVLGYFAALEVSSSHPLATSIVEYAKEKEITIPAADKVNNLPGVGIEGQIAGQSYKIVNAGYLDRQKITFDQNEFKTLSSKGNSISYLLRNNHVLAMIAQGDQIKPEAKTLIDYLHANGIQAVMLTGDNKQVASTVAKELGIDQVHAELMPEDKEKIVRQYQSQGHKVLMVGDGVNDSPSLARADIGVAIGAGTDVAIDSADVVLVKSNPKNLIEFFDLAKNTHSKMIQNLWWGAGYNILALPLAAGILAPWGIILSPAVGAILMSLSTVIVALNAMTLKLTKR